VSSEQKVAQIRTVVWLILDSVGVGAMPDAADFLDEGANTLVHTAKAVGGLHLPTLGKLGLGNIVAVPGVPPVNRPRARHGKMAEASPAKDTVTGHWELAGLVSEHPFAIFYDGFPPEIMDEFATRTRRSWLFNRPASGTEIIERLGREHMESGSLIVYTSGDSVFQIAAHEEVVPPAQLYQVCETARRILDSHRVARVIARPFVGRPGSFTRTYNRKDFCMEPSRPTLLDHLVARQVPVTGVGKIHDIFAGRGISESIHTEGNVDGMERTLELVQARRPGLIFVNLVDFDMVYGHRRNPQGYARALEEADAHLARLLYHMDDRTALFITADHGCDPTHARHTDHTREYVPILALVPGAGPGSFDLGVRRTFADLAATTADLFGQPKQVAGIPF